MDDKDNIDWTKPINIIWEKCYCAFCGEPTGSSSKCFNKKPKFHQSSIEDEEQIDMERSIIEIGGEQYPLFNRQCYFRQHNTYLFHLNYPISGPLATKIGQVDGVEKLSVHSKYRATVVMGKNFDEKEIKQHVTDAIQNFFQEVKEGHLIGRLHNET